MLHFHTIGPTDPFHPSPAPYKAILHMWPLLVLPYIKVQFAGEMVFFLLNAAFAMAILALISHVHLASLVKYLLVNGFIVMNVYITVLYIDVDVK